MLQRSGLILLLAASLAIAGEASVSVKVDLADVVEQGVVSPVGGITSAGQPDKAALSVFAESGYVAVIDMRTAGEERGLDEPAAVEGLGMQYVPFPISSSDINLEMAGELDALLEQCIQFTGHLQVDVAPGNRERHVLHAKTLDGRRFIESTLLARRAHIDHGDVAILGKDRQSGLVRLAGGRYAINRTDCALFDDIGEINLDADGRFTRNRERCRE